MQQLIDQALTQETPGKVMGLMGVALFSLAFLFTVSSTDASFSGTQAAVYNPFSEQSILAALDGTAASYSNFLSANFVAPLMADYEVYGDNLSFAFKESGLAYALGVEGLMQETHASQSQVAGAYIASPEYKAQGGMSSVYSMILNR